MAALATTFSLACPPKDGKMQQGSQGRQAEGAESPAKSGSLSPPPPLLSPIKLQPEEVFPI